jgi:hypothetical protein
MIHVQRLGQKVVGTVLERGHSVAHAAERGHHQASRTHTTPVE